MGGAVFIAATVGSAVLVKKWDEFSHEKAVAALAEAARFGDVSAVNRMLQGTDHGLDKAAAKVVVAINDGSIPYDARIVRALIRHTPKSVVYALSKEDWRNLDLVATALTSPESVESMVSVLEFVVSSLALEKVPETFRRAARRIIDMDNATALDELVDFTTGRYHWRKYNIVECYGQEPFVRDCIILHSMEVLKYIVENKVVDVAAGSKGLQSALAAAVASCNASAVAVLCAQPDVADTIENMDALRVLVCVIQLQHDPENAVGVLRKIACRHASRDVLADLAAETKDLFAKAVLLAPAGCASFMSVLETHLKKAWAPCGPSAELAHLVHGRTKLLSDLVDAGSKFPSAFWGIALIQAAQGSTPFSVEWVACHGTFEDEDLVHATVAAVVAGAGSRPEVISQGLRTKSQQHLVQQTALVAAAAVGDFDLVQRYREQWKDGWSREDAARCSRLALAATTLNGFEHFDNFGRRIALDVLLHEESLQNHFTPSCPRIC